MFTPYSISKRCFLLKYVEEFEINILRYKKLQAKLNQYT